LDNENLTKDIDFSPTGIRLRWEAGRADTIRALRRAPWNDACDPLEGVIPFVMERTKSGLRPENDARQGISHAIGAWRASA
jgi:NTE family protein